MLTQTTVKYFTIFAVSGTTVSITGGTDYTLVNAPITLPSYSKAASPSGYPGWFNYNANPQGFSSIPTGTYVFRTMGNTCSLKNQNMSAGTSNATTYSQTSPIPAVYNEVSTNVRIKDNGGFSTTTGAVTTTASSTTVGVFRDITGTPFTTSGGKSADFTIDFVF